MFSFITNKKSTFFIPEMKEKMSRLEASEKFE